MGTGTDGQEKATQESIPSGVISQWSFPSLPSATICGYLGLICVHLWLKGFSRTPTLIRNGQYFHIGAQF
ncbi:hypothetical protein IAD21_00519 [Abditibacteriota bacterium]|nr:hypothetical protein IAD21_00519 [Abditibacteriota bacterium]